MLETYYNSDHFECGIDEAGRGCLCGPVVVAGVIMDHNINPEWDQWIKDSKKLSAKKRAIMSEYIKSVALCYSISFISNKEIDKTNILEATMKGMHECIYNLELQPDFLLIDGHYFKNKTNIPYKCFVGGDNIYRSIAAASILAKNARDNYVQNIMHKEYPMYGWETNKGYGTKKHFGALKEYGITPFHRQSFKLHVWRGIDE